MQSWAAIALLLIAQFTVPLAHRGSSGGGGGGATFTHIQSCGGNQDSGSVSAATVTCSSAIGAGHLLYLCVSNAGGASGTMTLGGDSGTLVNHFFDYTYSNGGNTFSYSCWYVLSAGGGGTAITLTSSNGWFYPALTIDEWSVTGGTPSVDVSATPAQGLSGTPTSSSITTTANGDLVIGTFSTNSSTTAGSGYTAGASSPFFSMHEYQTQTTAGAITATASGGGNWAAAIIAFK